MQSFTAEYQIVTKIPVDSSPFGLVNAVRYYWESVWWQDGRCRW